MKKIIINKDELKSVYETLKNQKETAKYFKVSLKVIKRLVKEYRLPNYEHKSLELPPRSSLEDIFKNGGTKQDACEMFNVGKSTISKWLSIYGISCKHSDYRHLTEEQKQVVIGSVLGDGYISGRVLCLCHSIKQEAYLDYKMSFFEGCCSKKYFRDMGKYESVRSRTNAFGDIKDIESMFYINKKKVVPKSIKDMLSPLSVAIWYLDDGSRKGKEYGNIATCSFSLEETDILSKALNDLIGISTYSTLSGKYPMLIIPYKNNSFKLFREYIKDYVPESMTYKLYPVSNDYKRITLNI